MNSPPGSHHGIVTPEAVLLDFDTAGFGSRLPAAAIDMLIRTALFYLLLFAGSVLAEVAGPLPTWLGVTLVTVVTALVVVAYPAILETIWRGKTPGKAALGLRVITVEGAPIRFRHAAIRAALGTLEITASLGVLASVVMLCTRRQQRLGDLVAGTVVLRERSATGTPGSVTFYIPPEAEEFTATLTVAMLHPEEYLAVRSFLVRAKSLKAPARQDLAGQLAGRLVAKLRVTPPPWMTAEQFLTCIAVANQRRFKTSKTALTEQPFGNVTPEA